METKCCAQTAHAVADILNSTLASSQITSFKSALAGRAAGGLVLGLAMAEPRVPARACLRGGPRCNVLGQVVSVTTFLIALQVVSVPREGRFRHVVQVVSVRQKGRLAFTPQPAGSLASTLQRGGCPPLSARRLSDSVSVSLTASLSAGQHKSSASQLDSAA
jgi:hypothetical protein